MAITLNGTTGITTPALDADKIATTATGIDVTGTALVTGVLTANGGAVFNEGGVDADFRVESDTNTHMLFVDAGVDTVGIGRSSPDTNFALDVNGGVLITGTNGPLVIKGYGYTTNPTGLTLGKYVSGIGYIQTPDNGQLDIWNGGTETLLTISNTQTIFNNTGGDRDFRVASDTNTHALFVDAGNSYVNLNSSATPSSSVAGFMFTADQLFTSAGAVTTTNYQVRFYNGNGLVGAITTDGSATAYLTSSDQRLKENIADADDAGSKIDAIQVRKFDWKVDGSHQDYGMVAQELNTVAPEAVSAPKDPDEMMGVDYSKLVPMLIKEIQSLRARVADLES